TFTAITLVALGAFGLSPMAQAVSPGPIQVSSLFVPIEGNITEPGTTNTVHLTGEVHVLTHVRISDTEASVGIWANLVRVRGTSDATSITYLGVGADNTSVTANPGPVNIPTQQFNFALVSTAVQPGPVQLPFFLSDFVFDANGSLQSVNASFSCPLSGCP